MIYLIAFFLVVQVIIFQSIAQSHVFFAIVTTLLTALVVRFPSHFYFFLISFFVIFCICFWGELWVGSYFLDILNELSSLFLGAVVGMMDWYVSAQYRFDKWW